jgi:hypothetical protein
MQLIGSRNQQIQDNYFDASGSIASGGTAQLLLPQRKSCSHFAIWNLSSADTLMIQIGILPGVATISNGAVTGVTVPDAGFGFNEAPEVLFWGGGASGDPTTFGATSPGWPAPNSPAQAVCNMVSASPLPGLKINSITVTNPGSGYLVAPFVMLKATRRDPTGVGLPSATVGIPLFAGGGAYYINGTSCPTDAISVFGATTGDAWTCKWMP